MIFVISRRRRAGHRADQRSARVCQRDNHLSSALLGRRATDETLRDQAITQPSCRRLMNIERGRRRFRRSSRPVTRAAPGSGTCTKVIVSSVAASDRAATPTKAREATRTASIDSS